MSKNIILFFLIVSCFLTIIFAANALLVIFQQTFESVYADDSNKIPLQDFNFVSSWRLGMYWTNHKDCG